MKIILSELKRYIMLHGVVQGIKKSQLKKILQRISDADSCDSGGWAYEFCLIADKYFCQKKYRQAICLYNLAKFPYIYNQKRNYAQIQVKAAFMQFIQINKFNFKYGSYLLNQKKISFYYYLPQKKSNLLYLVIGGIVSTKEQWLNFLILANKFHINMVILEMPSVGENKTVYSSHSHYLFGSVIQKMNRYGEFNEIHIIAMSFGGHLAIKYALNDKRVKSIFTIGAPVFHFFKNKQFFTQHVPLLTKTILSYICEIKSEQLLDYIQDFAISSDELNKLDIPLYYILNLQDEIIPIEEKDFLKNHLRSLKLYAFNDVHGSVNSLIKVKLVLIKYILSTSKKYKLVQIFLEVFINILIGET